MPPMASVKFRPNQGEMDAPSVAAATAFPVMRVEEMYYIRMEAAAQQDAAKGKELLELFMKTRDPKYTCKATSKEDIIKEIYFQKCIDLWGEGIAFLRYEAFELLFDSWLSWHKPFCRCSHQYKWPPCYNQLPFLSYRGREQYSS